MAYSDPYSYSPEMELKGKHRLKLMPGGLAQTYNQYEFRCLVCHHHYYVSKGLVRQIVTSMPGYAYTLQLPPCKPRFDASLMLHRLGYIIS